jgi:hypothetical protein
VVASEKKFLKVRVEGFARPFDRFLIFQPEKVDRVFGLPNKPKK